MTKGGSPNGWEDMELQKGRRGGGALPHGSLKSSLTVKASVVTP